MLRLFLIILGATLLGGTSIIVYHLLGATFSWWDALVFAALGGAVFAVGAMRREES